MPRQFVISGSAVIKKIKLSQQARNELQNIAISVDTRRVEASLTRLGTRISATLRPLQQLGKGSTGINRLAGSFNKLGNSVGRTNTALKKTDNLFIQVLKKASAFRVSTIIINSFFNALSSGIKFTIEFDAALRDINKILKVTDDELRAVGTSLIQVAKDFNLTSAEVAKGARIAAQAGLKGPGTNVEKTISLTRKAALLAATSTLEFSGAMETLLAVMNQTGSSIEKATVIVSRFSAVEDAAAVDAAGLAEIFRRAGTTLAQSFGPNLNQAIGLFAALSERTRQSSSVIGTFAKTLGARLGGANSEAIAGLRELGISIVDSGGKLKNMRQILGEVAEATRGLGKEDLGRILGKIGGVRQAELFKAAIEGIRSGRADALSEVAGAGVGTQFEKAAQEGAKFENALNRVKETFNEVVLSLQNGPLPEVLNSLASFAEDVTKAFKFIEGANFKNLALLAGTLFGGGKLLNQLSSGGLQTAAASSKTGPGSVQFGSAGAISRAQKNLPKHLQQTNRQLVKMPGTLNRFRRGFRGVNDALPAFGVRAIGLSIGLGVLLESVKAADPAMTGFKKGLVDTGATFAQFLTLGPKIALMATLMTKTVSSFDTIFNSLEVIGRKGSNQQDTRSALLGAAQQLRDQDAIGNAAAIESTTQRAEAIKFRGGIGEDTKAEAELLANKLNDVLERATASAAEELGDGADPEVFAGLLRKKMQDFIGKEISNVQFAQLGDLLGDKQFLSTLGPDLQAVAKGFEGSGGTMLEILTEAAKAEAIYNEALRDRNSVVDALTKEELDRNIKLLAIRSQGAEAITQTLALEQQLFNVRTDRGQLAALEHQAELQKQLSANRISSLEEENALIKGRELNKFGKNVAESQAELDELDATFLKLNKIVGETSPRMKELQQRYQDLIAIRNKNADLLAQEKIGQEALDKIQANRAAIGREQLALTQQLMQSEIQRVGVEKNLFDQQNGQSTDLAIALNKEAEARAKLQQALSGGKADPVASANIAAKASEQAAQIRIEELNKEIDYIRQTRDAALELRKADLERILAAQQASLGSGTGNDAATLENIERVKRSLADISKIQLKDGEQINKLLGRRKLLEVDLSTLQLNNQAKRIAAEKKLSDERLKAAGNMIKAVQKIKGAVKDLFESQKGLTDAIRSKLDEAAANIKSKRGALSSAFDQLASARESLIDAMRGSADAFADFNTEIAKANIAADKILGRFTGLRDQASALNLALNDTIDAAARAGASEGKLAELRKDAAEQQLQLYTKLLDDTRSKSEQFFLSSGEDRQNFVQGLASIQNIAGQFGGNIENFRGLDQGALNDLGRSLISLPQDVRKNIVGALDQLPDGVSIAGLTSDEIREVLQGASLGESEEVGIERLSDTIQTVADLTRKVAELNTAGLTAQQKSLAEQQAAVAEAREQVLIAKNALLQAKIDAAKTQSAIGDVVKTLNTQIGDLRDRFSQDVAQINATYKNDAAARLTALANLDATLKAAVGGAINQTSSLVSSVTPDSQIQNNRTTLPSILTGQGTAGKEISDTISAAMKDANKELKAEVQGLTSTISGGFNDNITRNIEALESLATQLRDVSQKQTEMNAEIKIDNTQNINIKGTTDIANAVLRELEKKEFLTESDLDQIELVIIKIIEDLVNSGISRPSIGVGIK